MMKTDDALQAYATRKPFQPFTINLLDGEQILIDSRDAILLPQPRPELVIVFSADGRMHLFERSVVASLVEFPSE